MLLLPEGGNGKCQALALTPPSTVMILCPSALTTILPTMLKVPVSGLKDQRLSSLPGGMPSALGKVSLAGGLNLIPAGWMVMAMPGLSSSGLDSGRP